MKKSNLKYISVVETRNNIGRIIEDVYYNNGKYIVERRGKPYAIIIKPSDTLTSESKIDNLDELIKRAHKAIKKNPPTLQQIMDDIRQ